jgi:hypothetical protein
LTSAAGRGTIKSVTGSLRHALPGMRGRLLFALVICLLAVCAKLEAPAGAEQRAYIPNCCFRSPDANIKCFYVHASRWLTCWSDRARISAAVRRNGGRDYAWTARGNQSGAGPGLHVLRYGKTWQSSDRVASCRMLRMTEEDGTPLSAVRCRIGRAGFYLERNFVETL